MSCNTAVSNQNLVTVARGDYTVGEVWWKSFKYGTNVNPKLNFAILNTYHVWYFSASTINAWVPECVKYV